MFESFLSQSSSRRSALRFGFLSATGCVLVIVGWWVGPIVARMWMRDREAVFIDFERSLTIAVGSAACLALVAIGAGLVALDLVLLAARRVRRLDP